MFSPARAIASASVRPTEGLPVLSLTCAVKTLDTPRFMGGLRRGRILGAINHRYRVATKPEIRTGPAKSNMLKRSMPISAATLTTSRFVDVPMVVAIPPTILANPIGIRVPDGDTPVLTATPISIGNISTTIGVLLIKALRKAVMNRVSSNERAGLLRHDFASMRPTGSNAPVLIRPWPTTINADTAIRARLPKPKKKSLGLITWPSDSNGKSWNPVASTTSTTRLVVSIGMLSRVNSTNATRIMIITASACMLGRASSSICL